MGNDAGTQSTLLQQVFSNRGKTSRHVTNPPHQPEETTISRLTEYSPRLPLGKVRVMVVLAYCRGSTQEPEET